MSVVKLATLFYFHFDAIILLIMKTHFIPYRPNLTEEAMLDWVRRNKASVLVVVARKHNFLLRMFHERTTKKIAFNSPISLIILSDQR